MLVSPSNPTATLINSERSCPVTNQQKKAARLQFGTIDTASRFTISALSVNQVGNFFDKQRYVTLKIQEETQKDYWVPATRQRQSTLCNRFSQVESVSERKNEAIKAAMSATEKEHEKNLKNLTIA